MTNNEIKGLLERNGSQAVRVTPELLQAVNDCFQGRGAILDFCTQKNVNYQTFSNFRTGRLHYLTPQILRAINLLGIQASKYLDL